jgi:hypothetical protein
VFSKRLADFKLCIIVTQMSKLVEKHLPAMLMPSLQLMLCVVSSTQLLALRRIEVPFCPQFVVSAESLNRRLLLVALIPAVSLISFECIKDCDCSCNQQPRGERSGDRVDHLARPPRSVHLHRCLGLGPVWQCSEKDVAPQRGITRGQSTGK